LILKIGVIEQKDLLSYFPDRRSKIVLIIPFRRADKNHKIIEDIGTLSPSR